MNRLIPKVALFCFVVAVASSALAVAQRGPGRGGPAEAEQRDERRPSRDARAERRPRGAGQRGRAFARGFARGLARGRAQARVGARRDVRGAGRSRVAQRGRVERRFARLRGERQSRASGRSGRSFAPNPRRGGRARGAESTLPRGRADRRRAPAQREAGPARRDRDRPRRRILAT